MMFRYFLPDWFKSVNFLPDCIMLLAVLFNQGAHWLTRYIMVIQRDLVGDSVKAVAINKLTEANPVWALTVGLEGIGHISGLLGILFLCGFYFGFVRRSSCVSCRFTFVWVAFFVCFGDLANNFVYLLGLLN